jgi:F-type H+-transporting ATPase subunit epsilon
MKYQLRIVTPNRVFFDGEVDSVIVRGTEGDLAIMAGHAPFLTNLQIATSKVIDGESERIFSLAGGYLYVEKEQTTIVAEACEWADEIDVTRAKRALDRAEKRLKDKESSVNMKRAQISLQKAINRINISGN